MSTRRTIKFFKKCADETPKFEYSGQPIGKVESIVVDENGFTVRVFRSYDKPLLTKANITALPKDVAVLKCSTCGHMYEPIKKLHYIAEEVIGGMFAPETIQYWDAYDCPRCGTQKLVSERKAKMEDSE